MPDWKSPNPPAVIARLHEAWNAHDLDALVACFHPDYESVHPLHPDRNFWGRDEARRCWGLLFDAIPDFQAELYRCAVAADVVWAEWRWRGNHKAGGTFNAGGVMIFGLSDDQIAWARVYTETVEIAGPDFDQVLDEILSRETAH